jgi:hypothetical protein
MNLVNSADAQLSPVPSVDASGSSSPVPSRRDGSRRSALVAAGLVAAATIGFVAGTRFAPSAPQATAPVSGAVSLAPRPGEFRLAPGNQQPVGVAVAAQRAIDLSPKAGEFRLAPGNLQPVGITHPTLSTVDTDPRPGEFRLAPGNLQPAGIAVPAR